MIKDLLDVLLPEFKNKLPDSNYDKSQAKKMKDNCSKNILVMGYFGITLASSKWMNKVKSSRTEN